MRRSSVARFLFLANVAGAVATARSTAEAQGKRADARAASADTPAMANEKSTVKPAAERSIAGGTLGRAEKSAQASGEKGQGRALGPRIPEELRKALEGLIARRIDR